MGAEVHGLNGASSLVSGERGAPRAVASPEPRARARRWRALRVGTPRQFRWLGGIVVAVLVLNLADALLTLHWIGAGRATEANPVLRQLAHHHPAWFVMAKTSLVGLGSWLLFRLRRRALAVMAIFVAFVAYYLVFLYHLRAFDVQLLALLAG